MRTYRLLSTMELLFSVLLTVMAVCAVMIERSAFAILTAHFAAICACMIIGGLLLHRAITHPLETRVIMQAKDTDTSAQTTQGPLTRVLHFGIFSMFATLIWSAAQFVGFHITQRYYGKKSAAPFLLMMQLAQPVLFVANAAWAVLFSHVAGHWENGDREGAIFRLETAYKVVAIGTMTLTVALLATSDWWICLMPENYRMGQPLLTGLFMLFQAMTQLSIVTMIAKLHKRPLVIAAVAAGAVSLNVTLALRWISGADVDISAIALAGGIGMYAGGGVVAMVYMLLSRSGLHVRTYLVLALPSVLLLPVGIMSLVWAGVLGAAMLTGLLFDSKQKATIITAVSSLMRRNRGAVS